MSENEKQVAPTCKVEISTLRKYIMEARWKDSWMSALLHVMYNNKSFVFKDCVK